MTDRELMQIALEALEYLDALQPSPDYYPEDYMEARSAIAALRERLAQPEENTTRIVTDANGRKYITNEPLFRRLTWLTKN